jgi:hypothetical protein
MKSGRAAPLARGSHAPKPKTRTALAVDSDEARGW